MTTHTQKPATRLVSILAPLLVIGVCLVTYANSFAAGFVFDDTSAIVNRASVRVWPDAILNSSRPLTQASFLLSYCLTGIEPASFRLFNVIIHTLAALFLFGIIRRTAGATLREARPEAATTLISALVASLWAAHPLQTESVTYIVQRAESLAGLFLLVCLYAFVRSQTARRPDHWLSLSVIACALGMAAKPVMVVAPLLILLYDRTFVSGSLRRLWTERRSYYLLLSATWLVLAAILSAPTESDSSTGLHEGMLRPLAYFCEQQNVLWHYIRLTVIPHPLCLDYGWIPESTPLHTGLAAAGHAFILLAALWLFRRRQAAGFCILWFYITLLPTSGFFPVADLAVEHRTYAGLAGLAGLVAIAAWRLAGSQRRRQALVAFILLVWVGLLVQASRTRNDDYRSQRTIYEQVLKQRPEHMRARVAFTETLLRSGDFAQAEMHIAIMRRQIERTRKAPAGTLHPFKVRIAEYYASTVEDQLGRVRFGQGDYAEAERRFIAALAMDPQSAVVYANLAAARLMLHRPDEALADARKAMQIKPSDARPYTIAAQAHLALGDQPAAARAMRRALSLNPQDAATRLDLAWLLATTPDPALADAPAAITLARTVLAATGDASYLAHRTLAAAYARAGDFLHAAASAQRALDAATSQAAPSTEIDTLRRALLDYQQNMTVP